MAKKRRRKSSRSGRSGPGLSDGVRQSLFAIALCAAAIIFLLSYFGLAGSVGAAIDGGLAAVFGWDRWLFGLLLIVIGWRLLFSGEHGFTWVNYLGMTLFFLSFNGLLNLLMVDPETYADDLVRAGGYIGLLVSEPLASALGFWGAFVIAFAALATAIVLTFNISIHALMSVHEHFSDLGSLLHRRRNQDDEEYDDEEAWDEEEEYDEMEEEEFDDEEAEEEVEEEESEEDQEADREAKEAVDDLEESVMTSRRRRKMEIPSDLLDDRSTDAKSGDVERNQEIIRRTFENFGIDVEMTDVRVGPTVTQYSMAPAEGVKLSRIVALQDDLALALAAHPIRIEAPIPGKSLVGIEVPNQKVGSVSLREMIESKPFKRGKTPLTAALGKDVAGTVNVVNVDKAPHMLVAGATGSGKSVCLNNIIVSLLYQNGPDDLKLVMIDPKRVELGVYAGVPHLLVPPITKVEEAINALKWGVREMERRLDHLAKAGARDIDSYNKKSKERMPKVVIIIDELADLMSQNKRDVEAVIVRIAQMARAAGIHLVLATQRPSVDVITGTIKANIPTRIAFAVASQVDSKKIFYQSGAEMLLCRGDMLFSSPQVSKPRRMQGAYVSDDEIDRVVKFLKGQGVPDYNYSVTEDTRTGGSSFSSEDSDPLMDDAIQIVIDSGKASTSFLQRRMRIGYSRAARIVDIMEEMGIIGPQNGSKPREVLIDQWPMDAEPEHDEPESDEPDDEQYDEEGYEDEGDEYEEEYEEDDEEMDDHEADEAYEEDEEYVEEDEQVYEEDDDEEDEEDE